MASTNSAIQFPVVARGKRAIIAGRTGSGKTTLARWFLTRSPGTWFILNSKHDDGFYRLPNSVIVDSADDETLSEAWAQSRFVVYDPIAEENNPAALDAVIARLHNNYNRVGLYVDELYQIHDQGRAGPGLVGWLTRGRSAEQSFIGSTQRPAWVSRFCFSESDYLAMMALTLKDDRKRFYEQIGRGIVMETLPRPHAWRWYDVARDSLLTFGPVPDISGAGSE